MKLHIISGSHREQSYSAKAANFLKKIAYSKGFNDVDITDLSQFSLPFWNEGVWHKTDEWQDWRTLSATLDVADAFILITPEWHGMATPALKNFLLCLSTEMAHKPVLLASVSAGENGVYPISELRMTGSKNNHACFIPEQLIFRHCESLLTTEGVNDEPFDSRAQYTLKLLATYAKALGAERETLCAELEHFPFGM